MNLSSTIEIYAGGPRSSCHGPNCGRKSEGENLTSIPDSFSRNWYLDPEQEEDVRKGKATIKVLPAFKIRSRLGESPLQTKVDKYARDFRNGSRFPLVEVEPGKNGWEVEDGNHRLGAWTDLHNREVPVLVRF